MPKAREICSFDIYMDEVRSIELLSHKEHCDLAYKARTGNKEAESQMVKANLPLVVSIVKNYRGLGLEFSDLIQAGNIGLLTAVRKFEPERGFRFSTYASYWIKQSAMRSIALASRTIRIPQEKIGDMKRITKKRAELTQQNHREPTNEELGKEMDIGVDYIRNLMVFYENPISLDKNLSDENPFSLSEIIDDQNAVGPEEEMIDQSLKECIRIALCYLDDLEQKIIKMRYGFEDGRIYNLKEVGQELGVSSSTVKRLEVKILAKLQQTQVKLLIDYVKD